MFDPKLSNVHDGSELVTDGKEIIRKNSELGKYINNFRFGCTFARKTHKLKFGLVQNYLHHGRKTAQTFTHFTEVNVNLFSLLYKCN